MYNYFGYKIVNIFDSRTPVCLTARSLSDRCRYVMNVNRYGLSIHNNHSAPRGSIANIHCEIFFLRRGSICIK